MGKAHTLDVTIEGLVECSRRDGHAVKWAQDFVDKMFVTVLVVWGARREEDEEPAINTFGKAAHWNENLSEVTAVELPILRSGKGDHHARSSRPLCGTECIIVVNILQVFIRKLCHTSMRHALKRDTRPEVASH